MHVGEEWAPRSEASQQYKLPTLRQNALCRHSCARSPPAWLGATTALDSRPTPEGQHRAQQQHQQVPAVKLLPLLVRRVVEV